MPYKNEKLRRRVLPVLAVHYEYERDGQIMFQPTPRNNTCKTRKFVSRSHRSPQDVYMATLSHIERYGPTSGFIIMFIIETTKPITTRHLDDMVRFGLVERIEGKGRIWRQRLVPSYSYKITDKGRKYLTKVRALWKILDDGAPEPKRIRSSSARRAL